MATKKDMWEGVVAGAVVVTNGDVEKTTKKPFEAVVVEINKDIVLVKRRDGVKGLYAKDGGWIILRNGVADGLVVELLEAPKCDVCGKPGVASADGNILCKECVKKVPRCKHCGKTHSKATVLETGTAAKNEKVKVAVKGGKSNLFVLHGGEMMCRGCFESLWGFCHMCNEITRNQPTQVMLPSRRGAEHALVCERCVKERFEKCSMGCGRVMEKDEKLQINGKYVCKSCRNSHNYLPPAIQVIRRVQRDDVVKMLRK